MLNLYIVLSTLLCFFLAFIWSTKTWTNTLIKMVITIVAIFGAFNFLVSIGYLIQR